MSNKKYVCPECGADVVAWADIDAQISFHVTDSGKLEEQTIKNVFQSGGRCGVKCSKCRWNTDDLEDDKIFTPLANKALKLQEKIKYLTEKKRK
ncbi:hypothetical protein A7M79_00610 [Acinetobacter baumannii]|uniref:hypothetical protein n=1 Tax=Acinetobacter baumannii TaxID=470 RepID=UPI0008DE4C18|nr:hypothetical protein [Acinetobacter baumannii]OIH12025.1 hypothetical protein A7M79_00610 [Acinetobacter baumannii]